MCRYSQESGGDDVVIVVLNNLPGFLFFSTYCLLIVYWAEASVFVLFIFFCLFSSVRFLFFLCVVHVCLETQCMIFLSSHENNRRFFSFFLATCLLQIVDRARDPSYSLNVWLHPSFIVTNTLVRDYLPQVCHTPKILLCGISS